MGILGKLMALAWPERDYAYLDERGRQNPGRTAASNQTFLSSRYSDGSKYDNGLYYSNSAPILDNASARKNARIAYIDSLHAHAMVNRFVDSVVDIGLELKPVPARDILGMEEEAASEWALDVKKRFDLWAKSKKVDRAERVNFYQLQRIAALCQQRDGEFFIRLHYDGDGPNPLQLRLMDPAAICGYSVTPTDGSDFSMDGVKRDSRGRAVVYKISHHNPATGETVTKDIPARGRRSKLPLVLHGFTMEWPNQVRGYPRFLHALQEFKEIADFQTAHIKKAIAQSSIALFVKPSQTAPASDPLMDSAQDSNAGPGVSDYFSAATDTSADPALPHPNTVDYIPMPEARINDPGSVALFNLNEGEDLKPFANTAPAEGYHTFLNTFTTYLAASVGMPAEVLTMKFDQSYSAARGALIMFWRIAQIWRMELMADLLKPVYEAWLAGEIAAGRIQAPGWSDPILREAWVNCHWSGVPMPNIDPMKTARADKEYVEMGAQTLDDVAHNYNGSSYEDNKAQLNRELDGIPLPPWSDGAKTQAEKDMAVVQRQQDSGRPGEPEEEEEQNG